MENSLTMDSATDVSFKKYKSRRLREAYIFLSGLSSTPNKCRKDSNSSQIDASRGQTSAKDMLFPIEVDSINTTNFKKKSHLMHSASVSCADNIEDEVKCTRYDTEHSIKMALPSLISRSKSTSETNCELANLIKIQNAYSLKMKEMEFSKRRIVLSAHSQNPLLLLSIIPYEKKTYHEKRTASIVISHHHIHTSNAKFIDNIEFSNDGKLEVSYSHLLLPEKWKKKISDFEDSIEDENRHLDNVILDDPELTSGKHRTVLNLPSFITSTIAYAKPSELKRDINEQFKERHPHVTITLTKLRSIKGELLEIVSKMNIDPVVLAISYFYFERVILKTIITKQNRKCIAGACMLLSIKFFDDFQSKNMKAVIEVICEQLRLNSKDLLTCELQVLILLEFALILKFQDISDTFKRLESFLTSY